MRYDGPIIDAHHHLWSLAEGRYPWLTSPADAPASLGDLAFLRHDYLIEHLLADLEGTGVTASVHVEAVWDRDRSPVEETAWLDTLARPPGIAAAYVAAAPLNDPNIEALLAEQAAHSRVVGIRELIRWHPDPARSWGEPGITGDPAWRRGVALLAKHDLLLDLLMNAHQAHELADLAADFPDQLFVIDHCCSPGAVDRPLWREALAVMAAQPNIAIKLSQFAAASDGTPQGDHDIIRPIIEAFGPSRCMFGSDYPVARRRGAYADLLTRFRAAIDDLSLADQADIFHDTAARLYRMQELA
jgi:predicted TIM-barrel fold metal-dependent hydrolase